MILNLLNQNRLDDQSLRRVRIFEHLDQYEGDAALKHILIENRDNGGNRMLFAFPADNNPNNILTYYLKWGNDAGLYIDLPKNNPETALFLTAELTGCFVGVQDLGDCYRIRHYNFQQENINGDDLVRHNFNNNLVHWLAPERGNIEAELRRCHIPYELYGKQGIYYQWNNPVVFWGEYVNNDWVFYYQTTDGFIHQFKIFN